MGGLLEICRYPLRTFPRSYNFGLLRCAGPVDFIQGLKRSGIASLLLAAPATGYWKGSMQVVLKLANCRGII